MPIYCQNPESIASQRSAEVLVVAASSGQTMTLRAIRSANPAVHRLLESAAAFDGDRPAGLEVREYDRIHHRHS
jgi:hypothetical protein